MKLSHALNISPGEVVSLVGAGGKTTAMFLLADELATSLRVLTTTTTRIFAAQTKHSPVHVTFDPRRQTIADLLPRLDEAIVAHGQALLTGPPEPDGDKVSGVSPETIDILAASGRFEVIINEADGSRRLSLKAPAAHEPVIPLSTTLVIPTAGLEALARPLGDATVHRAELISHLTGTALGQPVTADTVARLLSHPEGGLKKVPARARVVPLLNKVDEQLGSDGLKVAREIANTLLRCDRMDSVLIGSMRRAEAPVAEVHSRIAAVILAAGGSTRFGSPKQLAPWRGKTFIEQVVDTALASSARPVVVVLGAEAERCRAALADRPVEVIVNETWMEGQSTSMQAGLAALPANIGGAVFFLVDLPGVAAELIDRLLQRHRETLAPLVWPEFEGRRGNPILFDSSLFSELRQVRGDTGGKPVLLRYQDRAERVAVSDKSILQDFDRPEDLAALETDR
ncbi:MAG: putative selenium-dependent hydroxylase accessory protein YqeC [Deltaproteobacteria bacterium]|nr:putative selenium-dependent hydroxylase accessory protein YqeC [Deltaproteobacteria bacterium]